MAFKIGFVAETEQEDKRTFENVPIQKEPTIIKKSVVDVYFPDRDLTCSWMDDYKEIQDILKWMKNDI